MMEMPIVDADNKVKATVVGEGHHIASLKNTSRETTSIPQ
jgi:hypothetical protein